MPDRLHQRINPAHVNRGVPLPFGLTVDEVIYAASDTLHFFDDVNEFLISKKYGTIESIILGNSYSGIVSEVLVRNLSDRSKTLTRNCQIGGHPDLIPVDKYEKNCVLKCEEGIEVKTSRQPGGWQGHNPEKCWIMVFRYCPDVDAGRPLQFAEILCALLEKEDWSFSGRKGESRRTPTASMLTSGVEKLRANAVYRNPSYIVNSRKGKKIAGSDNGITGGFDFR